MICGVGGVIITFVIDRLNAIKELCKELGRIDLIKQIDDEYLAEGKEYDNYNGRWFRDIWKGPYEYGPVYDDLKARYIIDEDLLEKYPRSLFEFHYDSLKNIK